RADDDHGDAGERDAEHEAGGAGDVANVVQLLHPFFAVAHVVDERVGLHAFGNRAHVARVATSGNDAMSPTAAETASIGVPSARKARISTRSSTCLSASLTLSATSPNRPNANKLNAMVSTLSTLSSGARLKPNETSRTVRRI